MPGELATLDLGDDAAQEAELPALHAVLVVPEGEGDQLLRAARAELAVLSLQLRTAVHEAEVAEARAHRPDLSDARALLDASLEHTMAVRRRALDDELAEARSDAALAVAAARGAAADVVAAASEEMLAALLEGVRPALIAPPSLRVVGDGQAELAPPSSAKAEHPAGGAVAPPEPEPVTQTVAPSLAAEPVVAAAAAAQVTAPAVEAAAARVAAPAVEPAAESVEPAAVPGPVVAEPPAVEAVTAPTAVHVVPPSPIAPPPTLAIAPAPAPAQLAVATAPRRPLLRRFFYVDVLLPMLAVLIVLVVLLAWVG